MAERIKAPLAACFGCAFALVVLMLLAYGFGPAEHADASLLSRLAREPGSHARSLAAALVHLGDPLPLVAMLVAVCGMALAFGRRGEALAAIAVVAGANLTTQALKVLLAHPRFQPMLGYYQPSETAFPSGHTTAAASIAVALLIAAPQRLRAPAMILGAALTGLVAISVIAIEAHYPSDVAGGFLVTAGWGFAAVAALRLVQPPGPSGTPRSRVASPSRRSNRAPLGWRASRG